MDTTDLISQVRSAIAAAAGTAQGLDAPVPLTARQASALINTILDQERELMQLDRARESTKEKVEAILDGLSCFDFSKEFPQACYDGKVFEVLVGDNPLECGRLFVHWDASEEEFYYPKEESEKKLNVESVLFWRHVLPEPHEAFDVGDL